MDSVLPIQTNDPFFARQINLAKHVVTLVKLRIPKGFSAREALISDCDFALNQLQDFTGETLREYLKAEDVVPTDNLVEIYLDRFFSAWEGSFAQYKKFYHPLSHYHEHNKPAFFTSLVEGTEVVAINIPSLKEAQVISFFDMGTQRLVGSFYVADTPAEKEVFRDGGKVVATFLAPYVKIEHGSTGVAYNSGDNAASMVKAGFKAGMLVTAVKGGLSESALKQSALLANIVVEPVAVTFTKMGKEWRQTGHNDTGLIDYLTYYVNHVDTKRVVAGISTGVPKKVVATMTSQIMAKNNFDSYKIVSQNFIEWEKHAFHHHFGISINTVPDDTYERGGQHYHKTLSQLAVELYTINKLPGSKHTKAVTFIISLGTFAVEYTAIVANTVIIATPVRVIVSKLFDTVHSCSEDLGYCISEHLAWYNTPLFATIAGIAGSASYKKLTMPSYFMSKDLYNHHGYLPHLFAAYSASELSKELYYFGPEAMKNDFFNAVDRQLSNIKYLAEKTEEKFFDNKEFFAMTFVSLVLADAYLLTHEYKYEYKDVARFNLLITAVGSMTANIVAYASEIEYAQLGSDLVDSMGAMLGQAKGIANSLADYSVGLICSHFEVLCPEIQVGEFDIMGELNMPQEL